MEPRIVAVCARPGHHFSKTPREAITLVAGVGVERDGHAGERVQHRSRVRANPDQPNLRQVHLLHEELFEDVAQAGFTVTPGDMGENVTTRGIDLLALPRGTRLRLGDAAEVEITGLRNPCSQIDDFQPGLLAQVVGKDASGRIFRKAGIMGIVLTGGTVRPGDPIRVTFPPEPHERLDRV